MAKLSIPDIEAFDAPDIIGKPFTDVSSMALISIAKSLKRIADILEKQHAKTP